MVAIMHVQSDENIAGIHTRMEVTKTQWLTVSPASYEASTNGEDINVNDSSSV